MARNRLDLQIELKALPGIQGVYYDPPASVKLKYDCIVYNLANISDTYADDAPYIDRDVYELTLISKNPDCTLVHLLKGHFKYIRFDRHFTVDGLHHWVYTLYF